MNRLKRALYKLHKQEGGLTGLETAIVLIAFVTVAAVFGYAVLSAGIFSTEKAKESVYEGMQEAKSTMVVHIDSIAWATRWLGHHDGDQVLEKGETVVVLVPVGPALNSEGHTLDANQRFSLAIKPTHGATIDIEKWIPASIDTIMDLK